MSPLFAISLASWAHEPEKFSGRPEVASAFRVNALSELSSKAYSWVGVMDDAQVQHTTQLKSKLERPWFSLAVSR